MQPNDLPANYIAEKFGPFVPWWLRGAWDLRCTTGQALRAREAAKRLDWPADYYGQLRLIRLLDAQGE